MDKSKTRDSSAVGATRCPLKRKTDESGTRKLRQMVVVRISPGDLFFSIKSQLPNQVAYDEGRGPRLVVFHLLPES